MKFFTCAAYTLLVLCIGNLGFNCYMFAELKKPNVIVAPNLELKSELKAIQEMGTMRDTQIMQGILMTHHRIGIHAPGKQRMCPLCEQAEDKPERIIEPSLTAGRGVDL